jgi:PEP-CTERM motif
MGHIRVEARQQAEDYIPDHFSHAALVHEVHIEIPYAREGLIAPTAFWEKLEATYLSDPRLTLRQHECPVLDSILRHDHLPVDPDAITPTILPPSIIGQTSGTGSPSTGSGTHEPGGPQQINSVPEPSSIVLAGLAVLVISACVLTRAMRRRRQSFVPLLGASARG